MSFDISFEKSVFEDMAMKRFMIKAIIKDLEREIENAKRYMGFTQDSDDRVRELIDALSSKIIELKGIQKYLKMRGQLGGFRFDIDLNDLNYLGYESDL